MPNVNIHGTNLYYREAGSGEPLLLVHGTGFNADVWEKVFDALATEYRTIAYDRRAYQRSQGSPPPVKGYGHQQGEDMIALLQCLGAAPAHILGWSAGGIYALHAALAHPDCVKSLVLFEPPLHVFRFLDAGLVLGFIKILLLKALGKKQAAAANFTRMVLAYRDGRNAYDTLSEQFRAGLAVDADTTLFEVASGAGDELKPEMLSTQIKVPVVILAGEQSLPFLTKTATNLARILHNTPIEWIPESNHLAQVDQPDRFVKTVKEALSQL
jgi:pimeloyl-ACP methyl ester carboxylesterase